LIKEAVVLMPDWGFNAGIAVRKVFREDKIKVLEEAFAKLMKDPKFWCPKWGPTEIYERKTLTKPLIVMIRN
jgi:hypothetical protein